MKFTLSNIKTHISKNYHNKQFKLITSQIRYFSITNPSSFDNKKESQDSKTSVYMWNSSVLPGRKRADYANRLIFPTEPMKLNFFEGKNAKQVFSGPRHQGVITGDGNLYTFGQGYRGILGHGNDLNIRYTRPKLVSFFAQNNIKVKKIFLGDCHSMALTEDGDLYTWGYGGKMRAFFSFYKEYGYIGHPEVGWKLSPAVLKIFKDEGIKIKDISCGIRHSMALTENGDLYTWGKGIYGLNGDGKNNSIKCPKKNDFFAKLKQIDPMNEIIKIDSADEFSGALTKSGKLYVWGKNDRGQLGTGAGIGVDMIESEKFPLTVKNMENMKIVDFTCGENTMLIQVSDGRLYRTGLKVDYTPSLIEITNHLKPKIFLCGNSFYCMISEKNDIYQWGNLFRNSKIEKNDTDMLMIKSKEMFEGKEILNITCKYRVAGAIVKA